MRYSISLSALAIALAALSHAAPPDRQPTPEPALFPPEVSVAAVGDILFGRYHEDKSYHPVPRVPGVFDDVRDLIAAADVAFCNLESPVMEEPKQFNVYQTLTFRADPDRAKLLRDTGFDFVSLANNHMFNMGPTAPGETRRHTEAVGLHVAGAGADLDEALMPTMIEVNGVRIAMLAYTRWSNNGKQVMKGGAVAFYEYPKDMLKVAVPAIIAARRYLGADFVIVSVHWGKEYVDHPDAGQRKTARALVDAGADLVLGHHPHVIQDMERYRGAIIAYSLGNFLFDNPIIERRQTMLLLAKLAMPGPVRHVSDVEVVPILIDKRDKVPRLATGGPGRVWRKRLAPLVKGFTVRADTAVAGSD